MWTYQGIFTTASERSHSPPEIAPGDFAPAFDPKLRVLRTPVLDASHARHSYGECFYKESLEHGIEGAPLLQPSECIGKWGWQLRESSLV